MVQWRYRARILVIRAWTEPMDSLRAVLRAASIAADITRVDTEPALNAAIERCEFDIVLYAPAIAGVTIDVVAARLREHGCQATLVVLNDLASLPDTLVPILHSLLN